MFEIQTILHPTDFSERSDGAFHVASALAREREARLVALHIAPPSAYGLTLAQQHEYDRRWKDLQRLQASESTVHLEHWFRQGGVVNEILRVAHDLSCDLIVMGTHGRTGLGHLLMGSVAEQVVQRAPCPVLLVKTPFPQAPRVLGTAPDEQTTSSRLTEPSRAS